MKLRAKSDHRIREFGIDERCPHPYYTRDEYGNTCHYKTLKEVADNWEEVSEEPKKVWFIDADGDIDCCTQECGYDECGLEAKGVKSIGNYFETEAEAEQAVEKLRAYKRLKDKGFKFEGWDSLLGGSPHLDCCGIIHIRAKVDEYSEPDKYLDLLFGGEE